jgi:hypothetical protein
MSLNLYSLSQKKTETVRVLQESTCGPQKLIETPDQILIRTESATSSGLKSVHQKFLEARLIPLLAEFRPIGNTVSMTNPSLCLVGALRKIFPKAMTPINSTPVNLRSQFSLSRFAEFAQRS